LRGRLGAERALAELTWLRVGGPAEWFYQPADVEDLRAFMRALPEEVPLFVMGVGSNLIVRDGGMPGVVLRLGRPFMEVSVEGVRVTAGAAALDAQVARRAAEAGVDLTFLRTIPGAIGGAVAMNAGCYGSYVADHLLSVRVVRRDGSLAELSVGELDLGYRHSSLPEGSVVVEALFEGLSGDPAALAAKMEEQVAKRDATQPTKDRTAGSTFRNPAGFSSTGRADDTHDLKAWKVIEDAGLRGATLGGAQMSPKHPNFLVNTGHASAYDLESLGEMVRKRVYAARGLRLEWEIKRVGLPGPDGPVADAFEDNEKV
jgi:UDP-N-acetylmuramate dehydrogenase